MNGYEVSPGPASPDGSSPGHEPDPTDWGRVIRIALIVWGVVLAIGSTGLVAARFDWRFVDWRRGAIVLIGVALFIAAWLGLLRLRAAGRLPTARASVVSLLLLVPMLGAWVASARSWETDRQASLAWGCLALGSWGAACVATLVALSDPEHRKWKWLAWVSAVAIVASVVAFIVWIRN